MIGWYQIWFALVVVLWIYARPGDRMALRIVGIAAISSQLLNHGIAVHFPGAWQLLLVNGAGEALTILALLHWTPNLTGKRQGACVAVALATYLFCYQVYEPGTALVSARSLVVIKFVAAAQIVFFHDTITHLFHRIVHRLDMLRLFAFGLIRGRGVRATIFPRADEPRRN